jgi:site-specific recombinase XerD
MAKEAKLVTGVYERPLGSGNWYARYWQGGKKVRKSFGRNRNAAVSYLEKTRLLQRTGEGIVPVTAKKAVMTMAEVKLQEKYQEGVKLGVLCDGLLADIKKRHQQNPNKYKDQVNPPQRIAVIRAALGHCAAERIQPHEIQEWYCALDCAPATQNRYRGMVSQLYTYGKRKGLVKVNPVSATEKQPTSAGVIRWMTKEEEARIRKVLQAGVDAYGPSQPVLRERALHRICEFDVALGTGMRRSEQFGLTWDQVDLDQGLLILTKTKALNGRRVYLCKFAEAAFKTLERMTLHRKVRRMGESNAAPVNVVFAKADNKKWWASVTKTAKVKSLRWHDLRHTFCSRLTQRGANIKVIQELAGHKSIVTTARYAHADDAAKRRGVALMDLDEAAA